MPRQKPNININNSNLPGDRNQLKDLILQAITDTFIYSYYPNDIALDGTGNLFTLYLYNKYLVIDALQVDNYSDYVDVYLYGIKQPNERYTITTDGTDITIEFNVSITLVPNEVIKTDFEIKGKIVEIV
jgi:hypothetical protein